jgi:hypothetical protein
MARRRKIVQEDYERRTRYVPSATSTGASLAGGSAGQYLQKGSAIDHDYAWETLAVSAHNSLDSLQGGAPNEYYHLTAAEYASLGTGGTINGTLILGGLNSVTISSVDISTIGGLGSGDL